MERSSDSRTRSQRNVSSSFSALNSNIITSKDSLDSHLDTRIYKVSTADSHNLRLKDEVYRRRYQNPFILCNSFLFLFIAMYIFVLSLKKQSKVNAFYSTAPQCCYCYWLSTHGMITMEMEFTPCYVRHGFSAQQDKNPTKMCRSETDKNANYTWEQWNNGTRHWNARQFSHSLNLVPDANVTDKFYPYYALVALFVVVVFCAFVCFLTFIKKELIAVIVFVGNIICSMLCFAAIMHIYQYGHQTQDAGSYPYSTNMKHGCYVSTVDKFSSDAFRYLLLLIKIYVLVHTVGLSVLTFMIRKWCKSWARAYPYCMIVILVFGFLFSLVFVILGTIIFVQIAEQNTSFNLMDGYNINQVQERRICIAICVVLFASIFCVVLLPHFWKRVGVDTHCLGRVCCCCYSLRWQMLNDDNRGNNTGNTSINIDAYGNADYVGLVNRFKNQPVPFDDDLSCQSVSESKKSISVSQVQRRPAPKYKYGNV